MDLYSFLYILGICFSYFIYIWLLISGIDDTMSNSFNFQLTIFAVIASIATFLKLPKSFSVNGTLREQCLFLGLFTLEILALIFNILSYRNNMKYLVYILTTIIIILYFIILYIYIPKFNINRNK